MTQRRLRVRPAPSENDVVEMAKANLFNYVTHGMSMDAPPVKTLPPEPGVGTGEYSPIGIKRDKHPTILNDGFNPLKESKLMSQQPRLPTAELLAQCADTISELSHALDDAQVNTDSLWFYCHRSAPKYRIAKQQLIEAGLIVIEGKNINLTAKGQEARIGVHTKGTQTNKQYTRFTPEVMKYIDYTNVPAEVKEIHPKLFINPDGELVVVENVAQFCKANGLANGHMYNVLNGLAKSHKGWKRFTE